FNLSGPVVTFTNNGTLRLKRSETTVALPATAIGGTVVYYGNGGGTISGLKAGNSYTNLSFTSAAGAMVYQLGAGLAVTGTLTTSSNDTLTSTVYGLTVGGTTTVNGTLNGGSATDSFAAVTGTGTFNASTGSTTMSGNLSVTNFNHDNGSMTFSGGSDGIYTFYNLTISGAVTASGAWTILNNLTIGVTGSLSVGASTITIGVNWTNNAGVGGLTGTSQVSFNTGAGYTAHAISGNTNFYDLMIDASAAPGQVT